MIALIGSEGSMGKRYQAILNYLGEKFHSLDRASISQEKILDSAITCDRIIIASPTHTHLEYLRELLPSRKPILCEKPITKDIDLLKELHAFCARGGFNYHMVMQYKELSPPKDSGKLTCYRYFRPGKPEDGLLWNCMQPIALANGPIEIDERSPIWQCMINGQWLALSDMDYAYVQHVRKWITGHMDQTLEEILNAHLKVLEFQESLQYETN